MHQDVLRMAATKEERQRIAWLAAERIFFGTRRDPTTTPSFAEGLALARQCEGEEDARYLASLFPHGVPEKASDVALVFLAHSEDARAMCWAAVCGGGGGLGTEEQKDLLRRSADAGYAEGMVRYCDHLEEEQAKMALLEKAAMLGNCFAMSRLAEVLWNRLIDRARAKELWRRAAVLGLRRAQWNYARLCCVPGSVEQVMWMRRAAMQGGNPVVLTDMAKAVVDWYAYCGKMGRVVYELGMAFSWLDTWRKTCEGRDAVTGCEQAIALYKKWIGEAKSAVLCWMWLSRDTALVKDVRLMIADLIWSERMAWSERAPSAGLSPYEWVRDSTLSCALC